MVKNSGQRIKGNLKPANSQRAAEILSAAGYTKPTFIGFQNTNQTDPFQKLTSINVNTNIDSNFEIAFKRIAKKDITTRIKALSDVLQEIKNLTYDKQDPVLHLWAQFFPLLIFNENISIKEIASKITVEFLTKCMDQTVNEDIGTIISYLFIGSFDSNLPKAKYFHTLFPSCFEKTKILSNIQNFLTSVFIKNFKGIKQLKKEDIDKNVFISTNILAIRDIILLFESSKQLEEENLVFNHTNYELILTTIIEQENQIMINPPNNDIVSVAYFALIQTSLMHLNAETLFNSCNDPKLKDNWNFYILNKLFQTLPQMSINTINFSENLIKNVWESVTTFLMKYKDYGKYIPLDDVVIPAILTFLGPDSQNPFNDSNEEVAKDIKLARKTRLESYVVHMYPTLFPLLHLIVNQMSQNNLGGDVDVNLTVEKFVCDFFLHFYNGSFKVIKKLPNLVKDKCYNTLFTTHLECLLYSLEYFLKSSHSKAENNSEQTLMIPERIRDEWYHKFLGCEISHYEETARENIFEIMLTGLTHFAARVCKKKHSGSMEASFYLSLFDDTFRRLHSLMFGQEIGVGGGDKVRYRHHLVDRWLDQNQLINGTEHLDVNDPYAQRMEAFLLALISHIYAALCEQWEVGKLSTLSRLCEFAVKSYRLELHISHFTAGREFDDASLARLISKLLNRGSDRLVLDSGSKIETDDHSQETHLAYGPVCKILSALRYSPAPFDPLPTILRTDSGLYLEFLKLELADPGAQLSTQQSRDLLKLVLEEVSKLLATPEVTNDTYFAFKLLEVCVSTNSLYSRGGIVTFFVDVPKCFVAFYPNQLLTPVHSLKFLTEVRRSVMNLCAQSCRLLNDGILQEAEILKPEFLDMLNILKATEFSPKYHALAHESVENPDYGIKKFREDFIQDWARTIHLSSSFAADQNSTTLLQFYHIRTMGPFVIELLFNFDTLTMAYIPLMTQLLHATMEKLKDLELEPGTLMPRNREFLQNYKDNLLRTCKWNVLRALNGNTSAYNLVDWCADDISYKDFLPFQTGQVIRIRGFFEMVGEAKEMADILTLLDGYGGHLEKSRSPKYSDSIPDRVLCGFLEPLKDLNEYIMTVEECWIYYLAHLSEQWVLQSNSDQMEDVVRALSDVTLKLDSVGQGPDDCDDVDSLFYEMTTLLNCFATTRPTAASFKSVINKLRQPRVSERMSRRLYDTKSPPHDVKIVNFVATVLKLFRTFVMVISDLPHPDREMHCEDLEFILCTMVVYVPDCLQILRDITVPQTRPGPGAELKVMCFHWLDLLYRVTMLMVGMPNALAECYDLYRMRKEFFEFFADALHLPLYQAFREASSNPLGTLALGYEEGKVPYLEALLSVTFCNAASVVTPLGIVLRVESSTPVECRTIADSLKSAVSRLLRALDRANTPLASTSFLLLTRLIKVYDKELTYSLYKETTVVSPANDSEGIKIPDQLASETGAVNYIIDATRDIVLKLLTFQSDEDDPLHVGHRAAMLEEFCYKSILTIESAAVLDSLLKMEVFQTSLHAPPSRQLQSPPEFSGETDDTTLMDAICEVLLNQLLATQTLLNSGDEDELKSCEIALKTWWNEVGLEYCQRIYAKREDHHPTKVNQDEPNSIAGCDPLSNFGAFKIFQGHKLKHRAEHLQLILAYLILRECPTKARRLWILNGSKAQVKWLKDVFCTKYAICQAIVDQEFRAIQAHFEMEGATKGDIAGHRPNASNPKSNEFEVKVKRKVGEITARYTAEDFCIEIEIKLPSDYPISPCAIKCTKKSGVSQTQWRTWLLQLNALIVYRDGTLLDGIKLWKRNVDRYLDGAASCMICFSIIDPKDYSLTKNTCSQCKNKYHSTCLYKWFSTSHNTTCPLCRNRF